MCAQVLGRRARQIQQLRTHIENLRQKNLDLLVQVDAFDTWIYEAVDKVQNHIEIKELQAEIDASPQPSAEALAKMARLKKRTHFTRKVKTNHKIQKLKEKDSIKLKMKRQNETIHKPKSLKESKVELVGEPIILDKMTDPFLKPPSADLVSDYNTMIEILKEEVEQ